MARIGIKRGLHRRDDASAKEADVEFATVREAVLRQHGWRCVDCGWKSESRSDARGLLRGETAPRTSLQVHHVDDNHANNSEDNLVPKCALDHAYHHIGCDAPTPGGHEGLASRMRIAHAPWLAASDLNLLQMAIGAAWNDPAQKDAARAIYGFLMVLGRVVQEAWGTHHAKDFAAAMQALTQAQYESRRVDDLRVLFHPDVLQDVATAWERDYPLLPPASWSEVVKPSVFEVA